MTLLHALPAGHSFSDLASASSNVLASAAAGQQLGLTRSTIDDGSARAMDVDKKDANAV